MTCVCVLVVLTSACASNCQHSFAMNQVVLFRYIVIVIVNPIFTQSLPQQIQANIYPSANTYIHHMYTHPHASSSFTQHSNTCLLLRNTQPCQVAVHARVAARWWEKYNSCHSARASPVRRPSTSHTQP